MQKARLIVTGAPEWCRKNYELTCYAEHFTLVFWAGSRGNRMVIQVADGKIEVKTTHESWRMWFYRVVKKCWNWFKDVAISFIEKALAIGAAAALGALPWFK